MKNLRHSRKALSPVVASIILIAVTVAVSIAVAAWMGALTTGFMATEELKITSVTFNGDTAPYASANVTIRNTGSTTVTISEVYVGNTLVWNTGKQITAGQSVSIEVNPPTSTDYAAGTAYQFKVVTAKGNPFVYTVTAPT
ncbi:MAG: archaellin/type IV pilin N-terminal domain-containing protein [Candidatus Bathyarchaeia archaeon]